MDCEYPPVRRPAAATLPAPQAAEVWPCAALTPVEPSLSGSGDPLLVEDDGLDYMFLDFGLQIPLPPGQKETDTDEQAETRVLAPPGQESSATPWFLLPLTWEHESSLPRSQDDVSTSGLHNYISTIRSWFFSWVSGSSSTLSNPLIHPELYRHDMPRCVQDAYTAVSTYQHRTADNTDTVLRILEARVEQLVQEQLVREGLGDELSVTEHLARVHALLAYQTLRLFDGDIRARAQADEMIGTLFEWCKSMWHSAQKKQEKDCVHMHRRFEDLKAANLPSSESTETRTMEIDLWHTFIHLESVGRAFLTANILQHVYLTLKRGWSECPGGVTVSIRRGVWEARSAYAWERLIWQREKDPLLGLQTMRIEKAIKEANPIEVDDFGLALMGVHFGEDKLERWLGEKQGAGQRNGSMEWFPFGAGEAS